MTCKVQIIDPNRDAADSLATVLDLMGNYEIRSSYSFKSALKIFKEFQPEIVILSLKLGAHRLGERLKNKNPNCKIIVVSGFANKEAVEKSRKMGFKHFAKPADPDEIKNVIDNMC